jgi:hypothetical protein
MKFKHLKAKLTYGCKRHKTPEHIMYCTKTRAAFCSWPKNTKPLSPPLNTKEGTTYLQALLACPKDFAEFLLHTKFYSRHCTC